MLYAQVRTRLIVSDTRFGHQVVLYDESIGGLIQIDVKDAVVGSEGCTSRLTEVIISDGGVRLVGEGVERATVV